MKIQRKAFTRIELGVVIAIILTLVLLLAQIFGGLFASEDKAIKALETYGFSEVKITDHAWFFISFRGGARSDNARFTATAKNSVGVVIEKIYVFTGWPWKGYTIRTD